MREYGKIKTCIWGDEKFQQLSVDTRLLFVYLQTSPHSNLIGCFRLPIGYVMADLGWAEAKAKASLAEALRYGLIKRCDKTGWTFIVNFLEHNQFESPNVAKTALKVIESIPTDLPFYSLFIKELAEHGKWVPEGFAKAKLSLTVGLSEGIGDVLANPEPEPNQSLNLTEPEPEGNSRRSVVVTSMFDQFWQEFPRQRRGDRDKALEAYRKVLKAKKSTEEKIYAAVIRYAQSRDVADGFAKGAAAWLNDAGYDNEPLSAARKPNDGLTNYERGLLGAVTGH